MRRPGDATVSLIFGTAKLQDVRLLVGEDETQQLVLRGSLVGDGDVPFDRAVAIGCVNLGNPRLGLDPPVGMLRRALKD